MPTVEILRNEKIKVDGETFAENTNMALAKIIQKMFLLEEKIKKLEETGVGHVKLTNNMLWEKL